MVVQELRVRYQRSMLGFLWTLLQPDPDDGDADARLLAALRRIDREDYAIYLFAGMVPWSFLSGSLNDCAFCIIANEGLIRKIYLPKLVFPLARVLINLTTFVLSMVALFLLLEPLGARFSPPMLLLPVVIVLFCAFALGLGLIVATANTFFRDCGHLVSVVPPGVVLRDADHLRDRRHARPTSQWRFWLNPAYPFIQMFQVDHPRRALAAVEHCSWWPPASRR